VDTDGDRLAGLLTVSKLKLESKGIDSVRARVRNLKEFNGEITVEALKNKIIEAFSMGNPGNLICSLTPMDRWDVSVLKKRYEDFDWNFGSTPAFDFSYSYREDSGEVEVCLKVEEGIIRDVKVLTDSLDLELPSKIYEKMIGTPFRPLFS